MLSSPLIVMGVLATGLTIGYLGLNNYQIRQESLEVAEVAERNDISLDESVDECKKNANRLLEKISKTGDVVKKLSDEKGRLEAEMQKKEAEGNAAMMTADQEQEKVFIELEEAEIQLANLTRRLYELTGQTPLPEESSFSSENYTQESSVSDNYDDGSEEEEEEA